MPEEADDDDQNQVEIQDDHAQGANSTFAFPLVKRSFLNKALHADLPHSFVNETLHAGLPHYSVNIGGPKLREHFFPHVKWHQMSRTHFIIDVIGIIATGVSGAIFFAPGPLRGWFYFPCIVLCFVCGAYAVWTVLQFNYHIMCILARQFDAWFLIGNGILFAMISLVEEYNLRSGVHFAHSILMYVHALVCIVGIALGDACEWPMILKKMVLLVAVAVFGFLLIWRKMNQSQTDALELDFSHYGRGATVSFNTIIEGTLANNFSFMIKIGYHLFVSRSASVLKCSVFLLPRHEGPAEAQPPSSVEPSTFEPSGEVTRRPALHDEGHGIKDAGIKSTGLSESDGPSFQPRHEDLAQVQAPTLVAAAHVASSVERISQVEHERSMNTMGAGRGVVDTGIQTMCLCESQSMSSQTETRRGVADAGVQTLCISEVDGNSTSAIVSLSALCRPSEIDLRPLLKASAPAPVGSAAFRYRIHIWRESNHQPFGIQFAGTNRTIEIAEDLPHLGLRRYDKVLSINGVKNPSVEECLGVLRDTKTVDMVLQHTELARAFTLRQSRGSPGCLPSISSRTPNTSML